MSILDNTNAEVAREDDKEITLSTSKASSSFRNHMDHGKVASENEGSIQ